MPLFLSFLGLNELFSPFINLILKSVIPGKEWMKLLRCVSVVHRNRGYSRFLYKIYSCSINNNTKGPFQIWLCNSSWPEICQIIKNTWIIIAKFLCFQEIQYFTLHNKRTKWNHHNLHHWYYFFIFKEFLNKSRIIFVLKIFKPRFAFKNYYNGWFERALRNKFSENYKAKI